MRYIPQINIRKTKAHIQREFQGFNNSKRIQENQFKKIVNMTSDLYPLLRTRSKRYQVHSKERNITGLASFSNLFFETTPTALRKVSKNADVQMNGVISHSAADEKKTLLKMGGNVIVYPNKIMAGINTGFNCRKLNFSIKKRNPNRGGYGEDDRVNTRVAPVVLEANSSGIMSRRYPVITGSSIVKPDDPTDGYIYLDNNYPRNILVYDALSKMWNKLDLKCDLILRFNNSDEAESEISEIINQIKEGDFVKVGYEGTVRNSNDLEFVEDISKEERKVLLIDRETIVYEYNGSQITAKLVHVVLDYVPTKFTQYQMDFTRLDKVFPTQYTLISKEFKSADYYTVSQNRMWGCSSENHEIYASKLGDCTNWNSFEGIASDSYAVTVGSTGDFTAAFTFNDTPIFFKENRMITIYGTRPSNYKIKDVECDGVAAGSERSLVALNGYIYYLSRKGIMKYGGGYPTKVSEDLDGMSYHDGVAGGYDGKYYLACKDNENKNRLFVYNTITRSWTEESPMNISVFETINGNLYGVEGKSIYYIAGNGEDIEISPAEAIEEGEIEFLFETGDLMDDFDERLYLNELKFNYELKGNIEVYVKYDNENIWNRVYRKSITKKEKESFKIKPKRCKKLQLKLKGKGEFTLYELIKIVSYGGKI